MESWGVGRKRLVLWRGGERVRARALMGTRTPAAQRLPDSGYRGGLLSLARAPSLSGLELNSGKWELQARSLRVWTLLSLGTVA